MKRFTFFLESMKNMKSTGTVTRSSRFVCRDMISYVDFENADVLVELGAGDGVITKHILNAMKPDTKLLVFEISEVFCDMIRKIEDDRMIVIQDSAENLGKYLNEYGYEQVHDVVSAIPFVVLPDDLAEKIVKEVRKYLRPKGVMVQLHYSMLSKKLYEKIFDKVSIKITPFNIPPAFLHICQ
jgi:phospholipid N-methyltransferase